MGISNVTSDLRLLASAADVLETYSDAEVTTTSITYVKVKEIRLARAGSYRIKFSAGAGGAYNVQARLYRNGVAVGTEHTVGNGYFLKAEDLSGWTSGDMCQIYAHGHTTGPETCYVKEFRIYSEGRVDHEVIT